MTMMKDVIDEKEESNKKREEDKEEGDPEEEEEEDPVDEGILEDAKPIGEVVRVSGKGRGRRSHYESFEIDGHRYDLWFYRPEEVESKGGGNWPLHDTRELFYSFHHDEDPAESVMHKCVVHFVPIQKQIPNRKHHPELPDIEIDAAAAVVDQEEQNDDGTTKSDQKLKAETPGSCTSTTTVYYTILSQSNMLTGETHRDKWTARLLQGVQYMCSCPDGLELERDTKSSRTANGSQEKSSNRGKSFTWPNAAVPAVTALEKASHDALSTDFQKYNQKFRQLEFNLKNNPLLARRLLNGELEPSAILNMSPNELKEGLTAEETAKKEPDESERMQQTTDARCSRCMEFKVGLRDIIQAGHGDRYQLECIACGNSWYASRDEASSLTIETSSSTKVAGTVGSAMTKPEKHEK
ncbi:Mitochondrial substrate carrier family protein isoform 1 [Hibiscus syriacus]|uniref:Mitochondrial substrate carrier family protein isoform 1 n=1 Tax=Hibiscus syriacus TaxID=106335 RepID=A0A6A2ZSU2_HIBSY|nr:Mitochondrial substrate carrier family protein isoform 1 [Hibiscus syriacus]